MFSLQKLYEPEVMPTELPICFAIDYSGSTKGFHKYHDQVLRILQTDFNSTRGDTILHWDNRVQKFGIEKAIEIHTEKRGNNGTHPHVFLPELPKGPHHLVLVTDGEITHADLDRADLAVQSHTSRIMHVSVLIIHKNEFPNVSVAAPFTRHAPSKVFHMGNRMHTPLSIMSITHQEIQTGIKMASLSSPEEFEAAFPALQKVFELKMRGKESDIVLRTAVIDLQKRIQASINAQLSIKNSCEDTYTDVPSDPLELCAMLGERLSTLVGAASKTSFTSKIQTLLRMTEGSLRLELTIKPNTQPQSALLFDAAEQEQAILSLRAATAKLVKPLPVENLTDDRNTCPIDFVCPLTFSDNSAPVLLIKAPVKYRNEVFSEDYRNGKTALAAQIENQIIVAHEAQSAGQTPIGWCAADLMGVKCSIMAGFPTKITNVVLDNPMHIAGAFQDTIGRLVETRLDHPISLEAYKLLRQNGPVDVSPFSRAQLQTAIPLGCTPESVAAANYGIMRMMTGGIALGHPDLWFAGLYFLIKNSTTLTHLTPLIPSIEAQMRFRMETCRNNINLSGLPEAIPLILPLKLALFSVLHYPLIDSHAKKLGGHPFTANPFRQHLGLLSHVYDLVVLAGLPVDEGILEAGERLKGSTKLMHWVKRHNISPATITALSEVGCGLRNAIFVALDTENADLVSPNSEQMHVEVAVLPSPNANDAIKTMFVPLTGSPSDETIQQARSFLPFPPAWFENQTALIIALQIACTNVHSASPSSLTILLSSPHLSPEIIDKAVSSVANRRRVAEQNVWGHYTPKAFEAMGNLPILNGSLMVAYNPDPLNPELTWREALEALFEGRRTSADDDNEKQDRLVVSLHRDAINTLLELRRRPTWQAVLFMTASRMASHFSYLQHNRKFFCSSPKKVDDESPAYVKNMRVRGSCLPLELVAQAKLVVSKFSEALETHNYLPSSGSFDDATAAVLKRFGFALQIQEVRKALEGGVKGYRGMKHFIEAMDRAQKVKAK